MSKKSRSRLWERWISRKPAADLSARALGFEQLEDRAVPATFTWSGASTGAGANANWTNPANWSGGVAPSTAAGAVNDLVFPAGAARPANFNDFVGLVVNQVTIQGVGQGGVPYTIAEDPDPAVNAITLGTGSPSSGNFTVQPNSGTVTFALPTTLATNGDQSINVGGSGSVLRLTAPLTGSALNNLNKDGFGRLVLAAANPNLVGGVKVNLGILEIKHVQSLGPAGGTETVVSTQAGLYLNNVATVPGGQSSIGEQVRLNGGGFDTAQGALYAEAGDTVWSGPVILETGITSPPQAGGPGTVIGAATGFQLNITGVISDSGAGMGLVKEGEGEVKLGSPIGNTYRGQTNVNNGVLTATHPLSLGDSRPTTILNGFPPNDPRARPQPGDFGGITGAFQNPVSGTVINVAPGRAGQLRLEAPAGSPGFKIVGEYLVLNGAGLPGAGGSLFNLQGDNTWAGSVILGSPAPDGRDVTIGVVAPTPASMVPPVTPAIPSSLTISGVIDDPNRPGAVLTKVGGGRLILTNANTYRGQTNISAGTITARDSQALGPAGGTGQTVVSEGAALELDVEAAYAETVVPRYDDLGRDTWADSVTNDAQRLTVNETLRLTGRGPGASGRGTGITAGLSTGGTGALRSVTGINQWVAPITMVDVFVNNVPVVTEVAIGVEPDGSGPGVNATTFRPGHPTPDSSYFRNDYSLTIVSTITGSRYGDLAKRGAGHLILPNANPYLGRTLIEQGWVTVQSNRSLGDSTPDTRFGKTAQQPTIVSGGAALHLAPTAPGVQLTLLEDQIILEGLGITHPYSFISQKGALINLGGDNIVTGDVGLINSQVGTTAAPLPPLGAGIGVERAAVVESPVGSGNYVLLPSSLTITGELSDGVRYQKSFSSGSGSNIQTYDVGAVAGRITVPYNMRTAGRLQIYYPDNSSPANLIFDSGPTPVAGQGIATVNFGPGTGTTIQVVVTNAGGWDVGVTTIAGLPPLPLNQIFTPRGVVTQTPGSLVKLGSQTLFLQGAGSQTGARNEVREGTLRLQNDTALGRAITGTEVTQQTLPVTQTEVADGATLELAGSVAMHAGGVAAGVHVLDEQLTLNRYGIQIRIAGQDTARFRLDFAGQQTVQLQVPAGYTGSVPYAQYLQDAINTQLTGIADSLVAGVPGAVRADAAAVVTELTPGVYSVTFGAARFNDLDIAALTAVIDPVGTLFDPPVGNPPQVVAALAEVQISGSNAPLVNLSDDNTWRGPVSLNRGTRLEVRPNSRLSLLGNITDTANLDPDGSDLVKRDAGDLTLGGSASDFRGTTYIDEGIVTAISSRAFGNSGGTTLDPVLGVYPGGTNVSNNAQLQLQGSLTIAGEGLSVRGNGTPTLPSLDSTIHWLSVGPGATNNGVAEPYTGTGAPTSARVNSIATDPTDPRVIYITTAGGGAWKTKDGGLTWIPLFDLGVQSGTNTPLTLPPDATPQAAGGPTLLPMSAMMFGGAIAVAPSNPSVIYYGTGDPNGVYTGIPNTANTTGTPTPNPNTPTNNLSDNSAGSGVYKSTDGGKTWTRLLSPDGSNPLYGQTVTKMVVDPLVADRVYVATGTMRPTMVDPGDGVLITPGNVLNGSTNTATRAGVWRHTPTDSWVDLTARPSIRRLSTPGSAPYDMAPPGNAGPDDDYRVRFPDGTGNSLAEAATWSDIQLVTRGVNPNTGLMQYTLYAALGESTQTYFLGVGSQAIRNAVYRTDDPELASPTPGSPGPTWWLGRGTLFPKQTPTAQPITVQDARGGEFDVGPIQPPTPANPPFPGRYGYIKIAAVSTANEVFVGGLRDQHADVTLYAALLWRDFTGTDNNLRTAANDPLRGELRDLMRTIPSAARDLPAGTTWNSIAAPTLPFGSAVQFNGANVRPGAGRYDFTLALADYDPRLISDNNPDELFLGGLDSIFRTTNGRSGGATPTWGAIPNDDRGFAPAEQFHALAFDASNRLLSGSDGGLWRWDRFRFSNLNSNLPIVQLNSADPNPTDFRQAVGGSTGTGTQQWNGNTLDGSTGVWSRADDASNTPTVGQSGSVSGAVRYDPFDPNTIYAVRDGFLRKSSDGGVNWVQLNPAFQEFGTLGFTAGNGFPFPARYRFTPGTTSPNSSLASLAMYAYDQFPMVLDPLTPNRVVVGGLTFDPRIPIDDAVPRLYESTNGGNGWVSLNVPIQPTAIGLAGFQGAFVPDPRFPTVTEGLPNTPDPRTIYVTDGTSIVVTKNRGVSWASADLPLPAGGTITDLVVNPVNRDELYATVSLRPGAGGGRIWRSLDAGQTWTDLTGVYDPDATQSVPAGANPDQGPLPNIPTWKVTVDPRTGTLYVGNDNGVWQLIDPRAGDPGNVARTADPSAPPGAYPPATLPQFPVALYWRRVGDGMPNVPVHDLVLSQTTSTLTAATYGRGMFQMFLPDYSASSGAVRAVSGQSRWTGPVTLAGNTRIGTVGTQQIQNGLSAAALDFGGSISSTGAFTLEKVGRGTLTLSGTNTYTGQTLIQEGVVEVKNPNALGAASAAGNTIVAYGAALQVRSNIEAEPITINGDGTYFNGHATGALRNVSGNNVYNGVLTLGTGSFLGTPQVTERDLRQVTIGVDSGSSLRIGVNAPAGPVGRVQGVTDQIVTVSFLGTLAGRNWGQITADAGGVPPALLTSVTAADGSATTGAGEVQQFAIPTGVGQVTFTSPEVGVIGTYANDASLPALLQADVLAKYRALLPGPQQAGADATATASQVGFDKELPGTLILSSDNTNYLGTTRVVAGAVEVRNGQALGPAAGSQETLVFDGAAVRIANDPLLPTPTPTVVANEALFLSGTGTPDGPGGAGTGALRNTGGNNTWAGPITLNSRPNFAPTTNPGSQIAFGVTNPTDVLTVSAAGGIQQDATVTSFGLIKVGPGIMRLEQANQYTGVTNVNEGTLRAADNQALGTTEPSVEVQTIRVFGTGTFRLNLGGQLTPFLTASPAAGATAATIAEALERLIAGDAAITGSNVQPNVMVTETPNSNGRVYTVTFRGRFADPGVGDQNVPVIQAANVSSGVTVTIDTPQQGGLGTVVAGGASLELDGNGLTVAETLTINGQGVTEGIGAAAVRYGALGNRGGDNTYAGTVTFGSASALGAQPGTTLTVAGRVLGQPNDPLVVPDAVTEAAAELTKVGGGTVVLPDDKEFRGRTVVSEGALQIRSAGSLGVSRTEVQRVRVTGTFDVTQYTLTLLGETTTPLTLRANGATGLSELQAALEALPSIGAGNVSVALVSNIARAPGVTGDSSDEALFEVTFTGALANTNLPQLTDVSPSTPNSPAPITLPTNTVVQGQPASPIGVNEVQTFIVPNQAGTFSLFTNIPPTVNGVPNIPGTINGVPIAATIGTGLAFDISLAGVQALFDAAYGVGNAMVAVITQPGNNGRLFSVTFQGALANTNIPPFSGTFTPTATVRTQTVQDGVGSETQLVDVQGTSGQYTLRYTNPATGLVVSGTRQLLFNATAAQFTQALTDPIASGGLGIAAADVRVTRTSSQGGFQYLVQFRNGLGNVNLLPIQVVPLTGSAVSASTSTLQDGPEGTVVLNGASLQVKDLALMTSERVTLNGDGVNGTGALRMVDSAGAFTTTWSAPLLLGSTAAIGVDDPADILRLTLATTDRNPYSAPTSVLGPTGIRGPNQGFGVNKVGDGTVEYAATGNNDYTGTTTVRDGTLLLNHSLPVLPATQTRTAVLGTLVVGDGVEGAGTAVLRELQNDQVANTSAVTVKSDGLFDLNGKADTIGTLTVVQGTVDTNATGTGGALTVAGAIVVGDRATPTPGGTIVVRDGGTLTGASTTMTGGTIQVGTTAAATANLGPVDMASGAAITGATGATINTTTVTAAGGSSISVGTGGLLNATGAVNLTASTLTVGQNATAQTNGNALTASQGSTINVGQGATLTTGPGATRGPVTLTDSTLNAGLNSTVNTGALTLTNSTFAGTTGVDLNTTGAVALTDSTLNLGNGPSANLNTNGQSITLTRSRLTTGAGATVTAGDLTATGAPIPPAANRSTIDLGAGTTAAFGTVNLSQSDLVVRSTASVTTSGGVTLTDATAKFGNDSSLTANGVLSLTRSQLGGNPDPAVGLDLSIQGLSLDASTLNLGNGPSALLNTNNQPTTLANGSALTIGTGAQFNGGSLTTNGASTVTTGNNSVANLGAVTLNGGSLTTGTGSNFNSSSLTTNGAAVTFGPNSNNTNGGTLTVNGATVALQSGATTNTAGLSLTAGHVTLATGATLNASGTVTVNAAATTSDVTGAGTFRLTGASAQTVSVANGTPNQDFVISSQLTSPNTQAMVKTGPGRLTLAPPLAGSTYPNAVRVQAGDVQVDTRTAAVQLDGATASLSGTGTVGAITGTSGGAVGTVTPGVVYAASPAGILTSGTVGSPVADVWGPSTTFAVTLANTSNTHPNPVPGTDYSQLVVNGNLNIGGATLAANLPAAGPNGIQVGDRFVIISSPNGGISGTFAGSGSVFVGGQKFNILYSPTEVVLEKVLAGTQTAIGSSVNPAQLKQPVTFTVTVTRENGAGPIPLPTADPINDRVEFRIDGVVQPPASVVYTQDVNGNLIATLTRSDLPAGTHTVTARFLGDNSNFQASGPVSLVPDEQIVAPVIGAPSGSATNIGPAGAGGFISPTTSPGVQDAFAVSATVSQVLAVTPTAPTATIRVFSDAGLTTQVRAFAGTVGALSGTDVPLSGTWDGRNTGGTVVADGTYFVVIEFADQWGNVLTTTPLTVVVDNTLPTVPATPTLTAPVIAPGTASTPPTSTTLGAAITEANPSTWVVTVRDALNNVVKTLTGTGTTVGAPQSTWDGTNTANAQVPDGTYTLTLVANDSAGNSSAPVSRTVYVLTVSPTVTVSSGTTVGATTNQTVYGQSVTLTALVSIPTSVQGAATLLSGKPVQFNFPGVGSVLSDNLVATATPNVYRASVVVPLQLGAGAYNYTATFPSTSDFLQGSAAGTHTVIPADLRVAADNKTRAYGDPNPALTYTVTTADLKYADTAAVVTGAPDTTATQASNAGTYPITQGSISAGPNYNVVFTNGTLTITQVPLTVRVNDATRARFGQNPPFTATFEGLKLNDTGAVVANLNLGTPATRNSPVGTYPITAQGTPTATNYFPITVVPGTLTVTGSPTATVVGSGGAPAQARVLEADGSTRTTLPFDPAFAGGIRTAAGDFNKDGVADYVVGTGPGRQAFVQVIDGSTGATLFQATPFDDFTGGLFVAAGDMTGDGVDELVVTPDEGGGPRVIVYRGGDFASLVSYFAIDDANFRGGVRPAVGDLNKDGFADLAVSAGFGGGPRVSLWDGKKLGQLEFVNLTSDFFAFEDTLRNGAFVAIGDVNGDGFGDLIAGAGPGGGPRVKIYSGTSLLSVGGANTTPFADFFAGNTENRGGVKVATKNLDSDKFIDLVTGGGAGDRAVATAYRGSALVSNQTAVLYEVDLDGTLNGVFVG